MKIQMKRIYDPVESTDCFRVLADRLWPRGVSKERANINLWAKDITPSAELRKKFHSGENLWPEFERLYRAELLANPALPEFIKIINEHEVITLLFAAKDTQHTHVRILMDVIAQLESMPAEVEWKTGSGV